MIEQLKHEKPIIKFFVLCSFLIIGVIVIFTPFIVMEKLIVTKFNLSMVQYLTIRTLEMLYSIAVFTFGAYGMTLFVRGVISKNGSNKGKNI